MARRASDVACRRRRENVAGVRVEHDQKCRCKNLVDTLLFLVPPTRFFACLSTCRGLLLSQSLFSRVCVETENVRRCLMMRKYLRVSRSHDPNTQHDTTTQTRSNSNHKCVETCQNLPPGSSLDAHRLFAALHAPACLQSVTHVKL